MFWGNFSTFLHIIRFFCNFCIAKRRYIATFVDKEEYIHSHHHRHSTTPSKTAKNTLKTQLSNLTKWYFRPKWKFNTSSDFLVMEKKWNFLLRYKLLIISQIQNFSKYSKKTDWTHFLKFLNTLVIYWLLMSYK